MLPRFDLDDDVDDLEEDEDVDADDEESDEDEDEDDPDEDVETWQVGANARKDQSPLDFRTSNCLDLPRVSRLG